MAEARCTCGFTEAGDETIGDHLYEVFAPQDGIGPDGLVHLEGTTAYTCLCGAGGSAEELDAHFIELFTPPGSAGPDGVVHKPAE
jgi:hypothetical protein